MRLVLVILMVLASSEVLALDSLEFQLFGFSKDGTLFDIRPYGKDVWAVGDVEEPAGVRGEFHMWVGPDTTGKFVSVGTCVVKQDKTVFFRCEKGEMLLSGITYRGQLLDEAMLAHYPDARRLYRAFIKQYEYGSLAANLYCVSGCKAPAPRQLIMVWRGD